MTLASPLQWPAGWPRTRWRESSRFDTSLDAARDGLLHELTLMGATRILISSNVVLRLDGQPAARQPIPSDPGVAVYFRLDGQDRAIPCDRWNRLHDNIQAIRLTVAALRGLDRWGARQMVDAAFSGFAALQAPAATGWWTMLGVEPDAGRERIERAYRTMAMDRHPDRGGDAEAFRLLTEARDEGLAAIARTLARSG